MYPRILGCFFTLFLLLALWARPAAGETTLIASTVVPEGSPAGKMIRKFAAEVAEVTGGKVKLKLRMGSTLGTEIATLEECRKGEKIQMWLGSSGAISQTVPTVSVLEIPHLFKDVPSFARTVPPTAFEKSKIQRAFAAKGLLGFMPLYAGWRAISTRDRPVRVPEDLRGMRIRSQPAPLHEDMWKMVGARPVPLWVPEIAKAYDEKRIDAVDLPVLYLFATSVSAKVRYHTRTRHMLQTGMVLFNRKAFDALPADARAAIMGLRDKYFNLSNQVHDQIEGEMVSALKGLGVTIIEPTKPEMEKWRKQLWVLQRNARKYGGRSGESLLKSILLRFVKR